MPRNRFPTVSRLAVTAGLAALVAIAPGWSSPTWASPATGQRHDHSVAAPKHKSLSGKWAGKYSGSFSGTFAAVVAGVGAQLERDDQDLWV